MNLKSLNPKKVIKEECYQEYENQIEIIWLQIVRLNANLFVLEKIINFPFKLFFPSGSPFWELVYYSLFETSIMIIWKIAIDDNKDVLTIKRLKNKVIKNLKDQSLVNAFKKELESIEFNRKLSNLEKKINDIRNNYIAHFNRKWNESFSPDIKKERKIRFSELRKMCDIINSLFDILCFDQGRATLPVEYYPKIQYPKGMDKRTDIEIILDTLVQNHDLFNMPENQPHIWERIKRKLTSDEIQVLKKYRKKLGRSNI